MTVSDLIFFLCAPPENIKGKGLWSLHTRWRQAVQPAGRLCFDTGLTSVVETTIYKYE